MWEVWVRTSIARWTSNHTKGDSKDCYSLSYIGLRRPRNPNYLETGVSVMSGEGNGKNDGTETLW